LHCIFGVRFPIGEEFRHNGIVYVTTLAASLALIMLFSEMLKFSNIYIFFNFIYLFIYFKKKFVKENKLILIIFWNILFSAWNLQNKITMQH